MWLQQSRSEKRHALRILLAPITFQLAYLSKWNDELEMDCLISYHWVA